MQDLTKRQLGMIRMASRQCGMSYRAAASRNIDIAMQLKKDGYLELNDNGRDIGRFVFRTTPKGLATLS